VDEVEHFDACAVCERTILRGERVTPYVTPDGEELGVCALCLERAEGAGWMRADLVATMGRATVSRRRRGLRLRERVKAAAERARPPERPAPPHEHEPEPEPAPTFEHAEEPLADSAEPLADVEPLPTEPVEAAEPELEAELDPEPEPLPIEPTEAPPPEPDSPERRIRHAIGAFNDSDQPRVVAGLMRSLGEPNAAIAETGSQPATALVTIAWELSWYRWEVAADSTADVREVAKGGEVSEIDGGEPEWNAAVNEEGKLRWRESS
jgi:hypothetical protein